MRARTAVVQGSAFLGLSGYLFWFAGPLYELVWREPNWWVFGLLCSLPSAYLVRQMFKWFSVRNDSAPRLLLRYVIAAAAAYVPMAVIVLFGAHLCLKLAQKPDPHHEGEILTALYDSLGATLGVALWWLSGCRAPEEPRCG